MPIYDYLCGACDRVTEVIHGINDQGPRFCPNCGAEGTMRKALTAPAVVFKGSGWAKVDRRAASGGSGTSRSGTKSGGSSTGTGAASGASGTAASGKGTSDSSGSGGGTGSSSDGGSD